MVGSTFEVLEKVKRRIGLGLSPWIGQTVADEFSDDTIGRD